MRRGIFAALILVVLGLVASPVFAQTGDDGQAEPGGEPTPGATEEAPVVAGEEAVPGEQPDAVEPTPAEPEPQAKPEQLKREGKDAQEARKAAMKALADKYPAKTDDAVAVPVAVPAPPTPREVAETLPRIEHHGYFRFRWDLFSNMDLDTKGTSPFAPPLETYARDDANGNASPTDEESLSSVNMRFRYSPIIHITEDLRVFGTFDILDNVVLGSTPDGLRAARYDVPVLALTGGTEEPREDTIGKDSFIARAAYAEVKTIFGVLQAGRMPSDWGLGILANGGGSFNRTRQALGEPAWNCVDCDYGDIVDRIMFLTKDPITRSFYVALAWDFVWEGLASYNSTSESWGQAHDLSQSDDVTQLTLALFQRPMVKQEIDERNRAFHELGQAALDWGVYLVGRWQNDDLDAHVSANSFDGNATSGTLAPRDMWAYIVDGWVRWVAPMGYKQHVKIEAEFTGILGRIEYVAGVADSHRDLQQLGGAIESEVRMGDAYFGLNTGFASGKSSLGFGYQDVPVTEDPRAGAIARNIRSFHFDRNYHVDLIMFRELVGGITNAIYFDPWVAYNFPIETAQAFDTLGARLDVITAIAPEPEGTPGGEAWYGLETDLTVYYQESDRYRIDLSGGLFVPGGVWTHKPTRDYPVLPSTAPYVDDVVTSNREGSLAWTIQSNIAWMF